MAAADTKAPLLGGKPGPFLLEKKPGPVEGDIEAGHAEAPLVPGIGVSDNAMRWGFIQKVYGIVGAQLLLTAVVSTYFVLTPSAFQWALQTPAFHIGSSVLPLLLLYPLHAYRQSHPLNLVLLTLWTAGMSVSVGLFCSLFSTLVIAEAVALTGASVLGLIAYTFYAVRKGHDFNYLGPMLFAALLTLLMWGLLQFFFAPGPIGQFVFALVGALIFSLYIVYDTDSLIKRLPYDEFIWGSVRLYLDIINLFFRFLRILSCRVRN